MDTKELALKPVPIIRSCAGVTLVLFFALFATSLSAGKRDNSRAFENGGLDESRIAGQVRHELLQLPYYGIFDDLAFRADGDTVTLFGAVVNPVLKSDAERAVKRVEGVARVVNHIEVLPVSPNDDQIRMAEYKAIYGDPALSTRYGYRALPTIHIIVKNGNVTLVGVVANEADKNLVGIRANSVPGVFAVANNLQVEGA
jgi:hyperosmotically inducible protein